MFGEVEVYHTCPQTKTRTLLAKENNLILAGASRTLCEIIAGTNVFGTSGDGFSSSAGEHFMGANQTFEASNYTIAAMSFGKHEASFSGVSGNAHTFNPDGLEETSALLPTNNVIFAVQSDELDHLNADYYIASAAEASTQKIGASGLVSHSQTGPELYYNKEKAIYSIVSGVSGCLTATGISFNSVSAGVSSAFRALCKMDSGQNKAVGFAPWFFLSYIPGIDVDQAKNYPFVSSWGTKAPTDIKGRQEVASHAFFEIKKAGGGSSDFSKDCDAAVSALLRISNRVGCSVPSGLDTSAMVFNTHGGITSTDPATYDPDGVASPYKSGLSAIPEVDERLNRDMAGFINHIQSSATADKGKGVITYSNTVSSVTYLFSVSSTDMIASNLYGGLYNVGLWVIDSKETITRARSKFYYLRNPVKYRLFAKKSFSDNLTAGVANNFTGSLDFYWTINFTR